MQAAYVNAAVPDSITILGKRLRPFCLGHYNHLARHGCAFIVGEKASFRDLLLCVLVCSKTKEENDAFFSSNQWERDVERWAADLVGNTRLRRALRIGARKIDWADKYSLLSKYLDAGLERPTIYFDANTPDATSPWQERLLLKLWEINPHWSETYLLNAPLTQLWQRYYTHAEMSGGCRFKTKDDEELEGMLREMENEEAANV